jgi:hypothetical protein
LLAFVIAGGLFEGLALGGVLRTGQVDPLYWIESQGFSMIVLGVAARLFRWDRAMVLAGFAGALSSIAILNGVAAQAVPSMAWLAIFSVMALIVAWWVGGVGRVWRWVGVGVVFAIVLAAGQEVRRAPYDPALRERTSYDPAPGKSASELAVLTGLPLFWNSDGSRATAPAIAVLEKHHRIVPVDSAEDGRLARIGRLLVAQPRLLSPRELVALDEWVRSGGRAVILADPLLIWPMDLPPGDRRRPPVTSLLDPLLSHWGLTLEPGRAGIERRFLSSGALLPVAGASHFVASGRACRTVEAGLMALCRIGEGEARLMADADLLDDRLWLADPDRPGSRRSLSGDTVMLLERWLRAPLESERPLAEPIPWVRSDAALIRAVRWALLVGMGWIILGVGLIWRREKLGTEGKNRKIQDESRN